MAKLDDASWHYGGDEFPEGMPDEHGATHIGMFAAWAIANGMWGDFLGSGARDAIEAVRARRISGRSFVLEQCDGKLLSEMLTPDGARFAEAYYPKHYMRDFQTTLAAGLPSDYHVEDTWANYDKLAARIAERFEASKSVRIAERFEGPKKPWWKVWWDRVLTLGGTDGPPAPWQYQLQLWAAVHQDVIRHETIRVCHSSWSFLSSRNLQPDPRRQHPLRAYGCGIHWGSLWLVCCGAEQCKKQPTYRASRIIICRWCHN